MKLFLAITGIFALSAPIAYAAQSNVNPSALCDGRIERLRISKIKPTGSVAGFLEAVSENNAWYKSHGLNGNTQLAVRVLKFDQTTNSFSVAEDEITTLNIEPKGRGSIPADAAWNAFVKKYDDNSEIVTDKWLCLPKMK